MAVITKAIRTIARVDKTKGIVIPGPLPLDVDTDVEVFIVAPDYATDEMTEDDWLRWLASNPVFEDWNHPDEDIYTADDGVPFDEHR